jgi:protein-L-isoaspartate O-methyltransferase
MWNLLSGTERVLEFGAGNSTFWFAARAAQVVSLEHSPDWYAQFTRSKPPNVQLMFVDDSNAARYLEDARLASERFGPFDIILIDGGPDRVAATIQSHSHLQDNGMVILDNSNVSEYQPAVSFLMEAGFYRQDFFGPNPGSRYLSCTSVFSRNFDHWLARQRAAVLPIPFFEDLNSPFRA